jgi:hypothetical protein
VNVPLPGAGNYSFTVYSQDSNGLRSNTFSFPVVVTAGVTVDVSGIFIAPTIDVDKSEVKKGDNLIIFGQSLPSVPVVISVHSTPEEFHTVQSNPSGAYLLTLDTSPLENGTHVTKSKAVLPSTASDYGQSVNFVVGDQDVFKNGNKTTCGAGIGDLNCDGKINIIDFSIMAFWYGKNNPPARVDLNGDGKITLVDFSILAYHWTG